MLNRTAGAALRGFDAIDLAGDGPIVVAVSGGSDSMALLFLLKSTLANAGLTRPIVAATVDHGLRAGSAGEAARVGEVCRAHGIAHETLAWTGAKPETGIQARARAARYALLGQFARRAGAEFVLAGHTLDDQSETVLMRSRRGGGAGLAGISPATFARSGDYGVWFLRPLLGVSRASLRDTLLEAGIDWIEDPSNLRDDFERVRARKQLAALEPGEALPDSLDAMRREASAARLAIGRRAAHLVDEHVREVTPGLFLVPDGLLGQPDHEAVVQVLRTVIALAGGNAHLPPADRAMVLAKRLATGERFRATMARVLIDRRAGGAWLLREARNAGAEKSGATYDNRYALSSGTSIRLPAPDEAKKLAEARIGSGAPCSLIRAALARQPIAAAGQEPLRRLVHPWAQLVPLIDLDLANALGRIAGAAAIISPPYKRPIEQVI